MWENVTFSKHDKRLGVSIPSQITPELAYETGIHIGDGSMSVIHGKCSKGISKEYRICYSGNLIDELDFHQNIIVPIIRKIYNKHVKVVKKPYNNTCVTSFKSTAIMSFKHNVLGLPIGSKAALLGLPTAITETSEDCIKNCIRGIADTDFSLVFLKRYREFHYYPKIRGDFANKAIVKDLEYWLEEVFGFDVTTMYDVQRIHPRTGVVSVGHIIELNGEEMLEKWMDEIGFYSSKHLSKYSLWEKFGFCPAKTSTPERMLMLDGKLDPHNWYKSDVQFTPECIPPKKRFKMLEKGSLASKEFSSRDVAVALDISRKRSNELLKMWHENGFLSRRLERYGSVAKFKYAFNLRKV